MSTGIFRLVNGVPVELTEREALERELESATAEEEARLDTADAEQGKA